MPHETIRADDGEPLHIHLAGSGTPLLLLHGWTASHDAWAPLSDALASRFLVLQPDARGHGGHPPVIDPEPDVKRLARDLINLLDYSGIERVAAVGHSMGALTLWQCLRDFGSERFTKLAFIDQSPRLLTDAAWHGGIYGDFDAGRAQRLLDELRGDFSEAVLRLIAFGLNAQARQSYLRNGAGWRAARVALGRVDQRAAIALWKSLVAADYRDLLPAIERPTLLAYGSASNFYTLETAHYVAARMPQARLSIYAGADHCPHLQQPARFAAELSDFLLAG